MKAIHIQYHTSIIGELMLGSYDNKLCLLDFKHRKTRATIDKRLRKGLNAEFTEQNDAILVQTNQQLDEYLNGDRQAFDIPLRMVGTDFQKSVWHELLKVPYGKTSTYLQLAKDIQHKKAVRAVANANGANAMSVIIPCHRIIGSNGQLGGYAGGLAAKKELLNLECTIQEHVPVKTNPNEH